MDEGNTITILCKTTNRVAVGGGADSCGKLIPTSLATANLAIDKIRPIRGRKDTFLSSFYHQAFCSWDAVI